jgi:hypothetical protein
MLSVLTTNSTSLLNAYQSRRNRKVLLNFNFEQLNLLFQVLQIKQFIAISLNFHIKALNGKK